MLPPPSPEDFLDRPLLRRLAGDQSFARGEEYFAGGRVTQLLVTDRRVSARVSGEKIYRVKLWRRGEDLRYRCDCDDGRSDNFCLHCVAVGLAWLSFPSEPGRAERPGAGQAGTPQEAARREEERAQLVLHLNAMPPERVVELLMEAVEYDEILRRRLVLEAFGIASTPRARGQKPRRRLLASSSVYRELLKDAVQPRGYVDWQALPDWVQGIEEAIAPLADWLRLARHGEVIELVEFVLLELDAASDRVDIGDPLLNRVYEDLQRYHVEACAGAVLNVSELAARLLHYELEGGLGIFNNAAKTYAEVLGPEGVLAWRALLLREWSQSVGRAALPAVDRQPAAIDHRRFQAQMLMERLAQSEGDVEALWALKRADLNGVRDHIALAEWLEQAGRPADALQLAERAASMFAGADDREVWRDFLIDAYRRAGRREEALTLAWEHFQSAPGLEHFRRLRSIAGAPELAAWPEWRGKALDHLRAGSLQSPTGKRDASPLVEALIDEDLIDQAWTAATDGGCRSDLWLLLAARREETHPDDAVSVYRRQIDAALLLGGKNGHREAIELVGRIRTLLGRIERGDEFGRYVVSLRAAQRKKRAFLRLLDAAAL